MKRTLKPIAALLLCVLLLSALGCGKADTLSPEAAAVKKQLEELPSAEAVRELPFDEQQQVYLDAQTAYEAYLALAEEDRQKLTGAEELFDSLFAYFNSLVMPLEG